MMKWKDLTRMAAGEEFPYLPAAVSATLFCLLAMCLCLLLHRLAANLFPAGVRVYFLDYIKSVAFCTYPFGFGLTRKYHGHIGYFFIMIPVNVISLLIMPEGSVSPVDQFLLLVLGRQNPLKSVFRMLVQVAGGISAFHLAKLIMTLEFHVDYEQMVSEACTSDLKISIMVGFGLEMIGTLCEQWAYTQQWSRNQQLDLGIKSFVTAALVSSGVHLTGMYMQPALATGYTFGCHGTGYIEHMYVYWAGPFVGGWLGHQLSTKLQIGRTRSSGTNRQKYD